MVRKPNIIDLNLQFRSPLVRLTQRVRKLVQHHMAHPSWHVRDVHQGHLVRDFAGIGYGYFIDFQGYIYKGRGHEHMNAHVRHGHNSNTIGIGYQGHFSNQNMTDAQLASGIMLNAYLCTILNLRASDIVGHDDLQATVCPGRNFRMRELKSGVASVLAGGSAPEIVEDPTPLLRRGARGSAVRTVQEAVGATVDGIFGPLTEEAVKKYQADNNLTPDGIVGPKTWAVINGEAKHVSDSTPTGTHTVKSGETMYAISRKLGVSVEALKEANKDIDPSAMPVGTELKIPKSDMQAPKEEKKEPTPKEDNRPVLREGDRGDYVKEVQRAVGTTADGIFGPLTKEAVMNYQKSLGLTPDGIVGPKTWGRIINGEEAKPAPKPEPTPAPKPSRPTLRQGSRGDAVREVQRKLSISADGIFGPQTNSAVVSFQERNGLTADGIVGPKTWSALDGISETPADQSSTSRPTVKVGSRGDAVRDVQRAVGATVDGIFGPATESRVRTFQRNHGLDPDGIVGPKTWNVIDNGSRSRNTSTIPSVGRIRIVNVNYSANIRQRPDTSSRRVGTIAKGQTIDIAGSVPGFWEVIYKGERAYIASRLGRRI